MLRVALTGGIGSGKSTAAAIFQALGAELSSSDEVARRLMQPGGILFQPILDHFGPAVLAPDGALSRKALAEIVFDPARVDEINRIVHPVVLAAQIRWLGSFASESGTRPDTIAIVETALLFETRYRPVSATGTSAEPSGNAGPSWRDSFDRVVLVTAPEPLRLQRFLSRAIAAGTAANATELTADFYRRAILQRSDRDKEPLADIVIPNTGSMADLEGAVNIAFQQLRSEALAISARIEREAS